MRRGQSYHEPFHPFLGLSPEDAIRRTVGRDFDREWRDLRRAVLRAVLCLVLLFGGLAAAGAISHPADLQATAPPVVPS